MASGNPAGKKAEANGSVRRRQRSGYSRRQIQASWWAALVSLTAMAASCAFPDFKVGPESQAGGKSGAGAGGAPRGGAPAGGAPAGGKAGGGVAAGEAGEGGAGGNSAGGAANADCTISPDGSPCETGMICNKGDCVAGCWIDGIYVEAQTPKPDNPCWSCDPEQSTAEWSDAPTAHCVQAIAAGYSHSCAVVNGAAYWWGAGQSESPVEVSDLTSGVSAIDAGSTHNCAVANGAAYCWGDNFGGWLGVGDRMSRLTPAPLDLAGVSAVAAGYQHSCAVSNSVAFCWGINMAGQLALPPGTTERWTPTQVQGLPVSVSAVGAGGAYSCALAGGAVYCWGDNQTAQLGSGSTTPTQDIAIVMGLPARISAIDVGYNHACALANGAAYCWGLNGSGQAGGRPAQEIGPPTYATRAILVEGLDSGVSAIAAGGSHTCAVVRGSARCWGNNHYGQLGDGTIWPRVQGPQFMVTSAQVEGLTSGVTAIAAGNTHTCAIVNGTAQCWGDNSAGQLGHGPAGNDVSVPRPRAVELP